MAASRKTTRLNSAKHRRETAERPAKIARAYELRVQGFTMREIAARMGCVVSAAHAYVTEALSQGMAEIHERGRDYVRLELDRLEQPVQFLQARIRRGDSDAIREHRSLSESRRKLLGLDARPDADLGSNEIRVTIQLPAVAGLQPTNPHGHAAPDVGAANADDRRPAPVPVDRDGDENR